MLKIFRYLILIYLVLLPVQVLAFYESQNDTFSLEARGLIRGFASAFEFPDDAVLYPDSSSSGVAGLARVIVDAKSGENWEFEFNAYQSYIPRELTSAQSGTGLAFNVERSGALETNLSDSDEAFLAIDRLAIRWSNEKTDIKLGRQAINLATTFYFTPNDFFAPFAAQNFFRVYKPGVDALRVDLSIDQLSQLSFISVLGYGVDANSDTGWSQSPDSDRISNLLRWSTEFNDFEMSLLYGHVVDRDIFGGALQGELFEWLGVRLEGHYADPDLAEQYKLFSLGLEHRWENSLQLNLEVFYNGLGANTVSDYPLVDITGANQYFARRYTALGGSYEITSLLLGQAVLISNLDDSSHLLSLNTVYSLSDESEMVFNLGVPVGDEPEAGVIKSEFGSYPTSVYAEFRLYF